MCDSGDRTRYSPINKKGRAPTASQIEPVRTSHIKMDSSRPSSSSGEIRPCGRAPFGRPLGRARVARRSHGPIQGSRRIPIAALGAWWSRQPPDRARRGQPRLRWALRRASVNRPAVRGMGPAAPRRRPREVVTRVPPRKRPADQRAPVLSRPHCERPERDRRTGLRAGLAPPRWPPRLPLVQGGRRPSGAGGWCDTRPRWVRALPGVPRAVRL